MVSRRPLVLIAGQIQQLPVTDFLDIPAKDLDVLTLTNRHTAALPIGTPVYLSAANEFQPARANAPSANQVIGLLKSTAIAPNLAGEVKTEGIFVATTAQWDAVTGQTGGLTPRSVYFLSSTIAGRLTVTPPVNSGDWVVRLGQAINATTFKLSIQPSILL